MTDWIGDTRRILETRLSPADASQALMEEMDRLGQDLGIGAETEINQIISMVLTPDAFWWGRSDGRLPLWLERLQHLAKTHGLPESATKRASEGIAHLEKLRDQATKE